MKELMSSYQDKLEFIKSPYIAEFLSMQEKEHITSQIWRQSETPGFDQRDTA